MMCGWVIGDCAGDLAQCLSLLSRAHKVLPGCKTVTPDRVILNHDSPRDRSGESLTVRGGVVKSQALLLGK